MKSFYKQSTANIASISLSVVGIILLILLLVSIYVNNALLPYEKNQVTKIIITALIAGVILIVLCGIISCVLIVRVFLFSPAAEGNNVVKHRRFKSLDESQSRAFKAERLEFLV